MKSRFGLLVILLGSLLLVACGSDDEASVTPEAPPTEEASPTAEPATTEFGQVIWAEQIDEETGEPIAVVDAFTTQSTHIYAVLEATDLSADTTFSATWTINGQSIEGSEMEITTEGDMPHAWLTFSFTRDGEALFPTGQLGVTITSSDGTMREGSIEIAFP